MFNLEVLIFLMSVVGIGMVSNYKFLLNIVFLLSSSILLFMLLLFSNNLLFSLIVLLVYVSSMLLLFMFVSTMLSVWEEDLTSEFFYLAVMILFVWDLLGYSFYSGDNMVLYSMCSYMWFYVLSGSFFLGLSLLIMVNMLAAKSKS